MNKGKLYIVATPIGNLSDMTYRSVEILNSVAFILAEDTRVSSKLMAHYKINPPLISYRDQNHERMIIKILEKLDMGLSLALISDAGTPTISDPGFKLVRELKQKGYDVLPIPGADAVTSSLSASGLPTDRYVFLGFLPKSDSKISSILKEYGKLDATLVFYESPNRLEDLLKQILNVLGDRTVCIANDITKMYEKIETDRVSKLIENSHLVKHPKGEFVVLIGKE
jgi:16S rRNA (cytidine1402-2'-O)-methyltransferase